jgi:cytochrome c oxidase subunit II
MTFDRFFAMLIKRDKYHYILVMRRGIEMKKLWMMLLAVVLVGALSACGGGGGQASNQSGTDTSAQTGGDAAGATADLNIDATNFKFDQAEYRVKAGETVNVNFTSSQGMHGLKINGLDIELQDGQSSTFVAEKGEYDIECSIMCGTGHNSMKAKLIVE